MWLALAFLKDATVASFLVRFFAFVFSWGDGETGGAVLQALPDLTKPSSSEEGFSWLASFDLNFFLAINAISSTSLAWDK